MTVRDGLEPEKVDSSQAMRDRLYEAQCLKCQDNVHSSQQEFDKAILTLSAGLLGVSLAFVKDIVPLPQAIALSLLYVSWGLSAGAILLTLISFWASKNAFNAQLGMLYEGYVNPNHAPKATRAALITRWLTYGEGCCLMSAVALTVTFAILNVQNVNARRAKEDSVAEMSKHSTPPGQEQRGVEPAKVIQVPRPNPTEQRPQDPNQDGNQGGKEK